MVGFIPAEELKGNYDIFGHFYSVKVAPKTFVDCRSVLEIVDQAHTPAKASELSNRKPDAVFIMMNPGSSRPLVEVTSRIQAEAIHELPVSLVPTKPDTTQYQFFTRCLRYNGKRFRGSIEWSSNAKSNCATRPGPHGSRLT